MNSEEKVLAVDLKGWAFIDPFFIVGDVEISPLKDLLKDGYTLNSRLDIVPCIVKEKEDVKKSEEKDIYWDGVLVYIQVAPKYSLTIKEIINLCKKEEK